MASPPTEAPPVGPSESICNATVAALRSALLVAHAHLSAAIDAAGAESAKKDAELLQLKRGCDAATLHIQQVRLPPTI